MPTRDTTWPAGTPCWIDYGAADVEAAKRFYTDLLGWTYSGGEEEYGGYLNCESGGRRAAGLMAQQDASDPPRWTTWFASEDVDATAAAVADAGGRVVTEAMDVGPMGRMAVALDPEGQPFGIWQGGQVTGVNVYNEPGSLVWTEGAFEDAAAARRFYGEVFGFSYDELPDSDGYTTFDVRGGSENKSVGGISTHQPGSPRGWTTCFAVPSANDALATTQSAGGKVTYGPEDTPYGRFAVFEDPWGAPFSVMEVSAG